MSNNHASEWLTSIRLDRKRRKIDFCQAACCCVCAYVVPLHHAHAQVHCYANPNETVAQLHVCNKIECINYTTQTCTRKMLQRVAPVALLKQLHSIVLIGRAYDYTQNEAVLLCADTHAQTPIIIQINCRIDYWEWETLDSDRERWILSCAAHSAQENPDCTPWFRFYIRKRQTKNKIDNNLFINLHKQLFAIYMHLSNKDTNHKFT